MNTHGLRESPKWSRSWTLLPPRLLWSKNIRLLDLHDNKCQSFQRWGASGMWRCPHFQPHLLYVPMALNPPAFAQDIPEAGMHWAFSWGDCPVSSPSCSDHISKKSPFSLTPTDHFLPFTSIARSVIVCCLAHWTGVCPSPSYLSTSSEQAQDLALSCETPGTRGPSPWTWQGCDGFRGLTG